MRSAIESEGAQSGLLDAHRDRRRFIVRGDEKLAAFLQLESAVRSRNYAHEQKAVSNGGFINLERCILSPECPH
jgi:hypothetical protein